MAKHHIVRFWLIMLVIFLLVFLYSYLSLKSGNAVLGVMPFKAEDLSIMALSVIGMAKSIMEMW